MPVSRERARFQSRMHRRRESASRYAAERARRERCPFRLGKSYVCNARLEISVDRNGRTVSHCPQCARREAGICQDCPHPVFGQVRKALRCRECRRARKRAIKRAFYAEHAEELRPLQRERHAAFRAAHPGHDAAASRRWRQRHPDRARAVRARWISKNPQRIKVLRHRWYKTYKAKLRARQAAA